MGWLVIVIASLFIILINSFPNISAQSSPVVKLDQESYSWTERAYIEVVSQAHVGADHISVSVFTKDHFLENYKLIEDSTKPGSFVGYVTLTGFEHDAFGDGTVATEPRTAGTGPTDGLLAADRDDTLTIEFVYEDRVFLNSSDIAWTEGEIFWDGNDCPIDTLCKVSVRDPDMNIHPDRLDHLYEVILFSDTDHVGIDVVMVETGDDTGVFSWHYSTTTEGPSVGQKLLVSQGDNITVKYVDNTPPQPFAANVPHDVTDSIVFGSGKSTEWILDQVLQGLEGDGLLINFENLDDYFSTVNTLKDLLDRLGMHYTIENIPTYENKKLVLTKKLRFETSTPTEFERIFKKDPTTFPKQFNGAVIDENYVMQEILAKLESCPQNLPPKYCNIDTNVLKDQILHKIGNHTISESIILHQVAMDLTNGQLTPSLSTILRTNNEQKINVESHALFSEISEIDNVLLQTAIAQPSSSTHVSIPHGTNIVGCESTNECFIPAKVSINVGDSVIWFNDDEAVHTVTSGTVTNGNDGIFDSGIIAADSTFRVIFDESGNYDYFCMVHPWMVGAVHVIQQDSFVPQSDSGGASFSEEIRFLNGFTLGYGFGKTWSYEYNVGFPVLYVEAHIEAGLGVGLRIPVDIEVKIDKVAPQTPTGNMPYYTSMTIHTKDLNENEYAKLLPPEKVFEGKEFNTYLGPAAYIKVSLFGTEVFEREEGAKKPESRNFVPPLGDEQISFTQFDVDLCDVARICLPSYIGEISLSAGVEGSISADKITISSIPMNAQEQSHEVTFTSNGQQRDYNYRLTVPSEFIIHLSDLQYNSNLQFTPRITVELGSPYIPFPFISEQIKFPGIEYPNIVLGSHIGTNNEYAVPEFDAITLMILAAAISSIIIFTIRSRLTMVPKIKKY